MDKDVNLHFNVTELSLRYCTLRFKLINLLQSGIIHQVSPYHKYNFVLNVIRKCLTTLVNVDIFYRMCVWVSFCWLARCESILVTIYKCLCVSIIRIYAFMCVKLWVFMCRCLSVVSICECNYLFVTQQN